MSLFCCTVEWLCRCLVVLLSGCVVVCVVVLSGCIGVCVVVLSG